jgi:hypothetical protein
MTSMTFRRIACSAFCDGRLRRSQPLMPVPGPGEQFRQRIEHRVHGD